MASYRIVIILTVQAVAHVCRFLSFNCVTTYILICTEFQTNSEWERSMTVTSKSEQYHIKHQAADIKSSKI